ncbi:chromosome segregation protein SMC [Peredibacter sp. HCB2-198]|uniref:chromosome segregation protein SMC n=1 Tax=Peredibacter sp. HCB2-198 TaxID=3383025 RepID=UPI0038B64481
MRLNRLIIQGFKSFKDKTVIIFDEGITGIVGPNGCGKSNIVDALFWVMGEQSAKHLRGTAMKDLIFAGSSKYQPASFAEVTLVLDNVNGKHININGTISKPAEIHLTRKLYRNGETEYRINNEPARLKDIHEVFMDTGAGAKSYSIIAQGEINKLVQQKPEERRVMIEEVAGITKFKLRKRESLKKIEQTQLNLTRLEDLQNEIYKNLKKLEQQAEKAEKAKTLRDRIKKYELIVESHREHDYLQDFVNADSMLASRQVEHENLTLRKSQVELLLEDEKIQKTDMMEKIDVAQDDFNDHSKQLAASEERVKHLKKSLIDKEKQIDRANRENEELNVDIEKRSERLEALTAQLADLEANNYEQMDFSSLEEKVEILKSQMFDLEEELNEKRRELNASKEKFQGLDNEAFKNSSKLEEYSRLLQDLTSEIETLEKSTSNFTDDLMKDRATVKSSGAKVEELKAALPALKEEVETINNELKANDVKFRELSREVIQLESKRNSLIEINNSAEGRRAGAVKLVQKVTDGSLEVLGKLIECDPEYAVAVEQLIGESLDVVLATSGKEAFANLMTDFDATVDLLWPQEATISQESIGRLETQGCQNMKALVDIVRINNQEYADKLSKILNGFFVVENLTTELASRINPEIQFKGLVSKDGKVLIKKVGNSVVYGVRHDSASEAQGIVQRNNLIQEMGVELEAKQAELAILETNIMQLETTLAEKRVALEEKNKEFNEINTLYAATKAALESKEANQSSNSSRLQILQNRKSETSKLRLDLIEADEKILNAKEEFEGKVKELSSEVADIEDRFSELKVSFENERDEMMELKVKAQSYQQQLTSLKSQIEDVNAQIDRYREKQEANLELLNNFQSEIENAQVEVENVEASNRDQAEVLAEKETYLNLLKDQIAQILLSMQEKESELKEINSRLNKIEKENVELELRTSQIIQEEELLAKDIFERYKIDLRSTMMKHLEITSDKIEGLKDLSSMYMMETEDGPKEIEAIEYEFEKRFPGQIKEAKEKFKDYKSEFNRLGEINWAAIEDYDRQKLRYDFLKAQEEELKKSLTDLQTAIAHIDEKSKERFKEAFNEVNERFSKVFPIIFGGGEARLEVTGDLDSIDCGVEITAKPPGKKMTSITLMSGGEKAMTAVSLIFSIFLVKPSPFCLLDEVDAPLDDANVGRFNELLREMSSESQFILITHNKKTMELNDTLYGVTMQEPGVSKAVSVQLH